MEYTAIEWIGPLLFRNADYSNKKPSVSSSHESSTFDTPYISESALTVPSTPDSRANIMYTTYAHSTNFLAAGCLCPIVLIDPVPVPAFLLFVVRSTNKRAIPLLGREVTDPNSCGPSRSKHKVYLGYQMNRELT